MNYRIVTYGCQMNRSDSERIAAILDSVGCKPAASAKEADLLLVNSCSVRQSAINRIHGIIKNLKSQQRPGLCKTILTGCVLESDKKKFADKFDLIIDIKELTKNPEKLVEMLNSSSGKQEFKTFNHTDYFKINPQYRSNFSAYAPIMTGCDNFCSYCAVPYTRGREMSRPAKEIIAEVKWLVEKGYKEITLLGQNVNSYISKIPNYKSQITNKSQNTNLKQTSAAAKAMVDKQNSKQINFPELLGMINDIHGNFWIRFLTSHPKDMSEELIKTMAKCEKVCEYVHLPIQSGDDEILRKMNRRYTAAHYLELIKKIRQVYDIRINNCHPEFISGSKKLGKRKMLKQVQHDNFLPLAISTDIIVGFPGETKKQFENTAKIMEKVKFDMAYLAEYSPRSGTAAAKLTDNVPILEKKRRKKILNDILKKTALANNKKYIGKIVEVLIEKVEDGFLFGKTRTFKNVRVKSRIKTGQFAKIKITQANAWGLEGEIV